jgi:hypothetical protein
MLSGVSLTEAWRDPQINDKKHGFSNEKSPGAPSDEPGHQGDFNSPVQLLSACRGLPSSCPRPKPVFIRARASMPEQEVSSEDPQEHPAEAEADP